ncbi:MAG: hypothetical protein ACJ8C4_01485 [Gemmataceae bacterium]
MKFLLEHEAGFDNERLGYPSISGCHAICYLTGVGLFGFHNAGGSGPDKFAERARIFGDYVRAFSPNIKGLHLHGCSFVSENRRGYSAPAQDNWKAELKAFASDLGFKGPISGYDLSHLNTTSSAYVEYRRVGSSCLMFAQPWTETGKTTGANTGGVRQQKLVGSGQNPSVVTAVDTASLTQVFPVQMR